MIIYLVRHAQSVANQHCGIELASDSPLTEHGEQQAKALLRFFEHLPVTHIYSSNQRRAEATVAPLSSSKQVILHATPLLREPVAGRKNEQFLPPVEALRLLENWQPSGSPAQARTETHVALVTRLQQFLSILPLTTAAAQIVVYSHFVTLNTLVPLLLGNGPPPARVWADFENASITSVEIEAHKPVLRGNLKYLNRVVT